MPMNMGMMIMNRLGSDLSDSDEEDERARLNGRRIDGEDEDEQRERSSEEEEEQESLERGRISGLQQILRHYALMEQPNVRRLRNESDANEHMEQEEEKEEQVVEDHKETTDEEDQGFEDAEENVHEAEMKPEAKAATDVGDASSHAEALETEEEDEMESSTAIPIGSGASRKRYSSNASMSTSYTSSGVGTCSSVEEPLDFSREISREEPPVIEEIPEPIKVSGAAAATKVEPPPIGTFQTKAAGLQNSSNGIESKSENSRTENGTAAQSDEDNGVPRPSGVRHHSEREYESHNAVMDMDYEDDSDDSADSDDSMEGDAPADRIKEEEEEEEEEEVSVISSGYSLYMHEKISTLPVPSSIKQYLMFYRT